MFDGAQTAGQFPLDLHAIGCDFYAITGYKWLLGPYGCGLCYVREDLLPIVRTHRLGKGVLDHDTMTYVADPTAQRYEFGVRNVILRIGFGAALQYMADLGIEAVQRRALALATYFRQHVSMIPGARMVGPGDPSLSSAITSIVLEGVEPRDLADAAWRANIVIVPTEAAKGRPDLAGVRVSPTFYNTEDDVDALVHVIASHMPRG